MRVRGSPRQIWPMVFGLSVFAFAAVAIAAFMLASDISEPVVIAGALFLLAAGQFTVILSLSARTVRIEEQTEALEAMFDRLAEKSGDVEMRLAETERLAEAERLAGAPARGKLDELMAEVKALQGSIRSLLDGGRPAEAKPAAIRWGTVRNAQPSRAAAPETKTDKADEEQRLDLLLEPVIELSTGSTAHYRALLDLTGGNGQVVQHAVLMQKADQGGMRAALDAHMLKQVVPVLRRLRNRTPNLRAFVPIGAATLQSRDDLERMTGLLAHEADVARGIVFEISHRDLGRLGDAGIEGLARLGRAGATLALCDVQAAGLDLAALKQLGVRFLSFPPSAVDAGFGPAPAWREFIQYARAMQFQIIVADVRSSQQADAASRLARFAHGSFYAPPRKVRADAGLAAVAQRSAAA